MSSLTQMFPMALATGNTFVMKCSERDPGAGTRRVLYGSCCNAGNMTHPSLTLYLNAP